MSVWKIAILLISLTVGLALFLELIGLVMSAIFGTDSPIRFRRNNTKKTKGGSR